MVSRTIYRQNIFIDQGVPGIGFNDSARARGAIIGMKMIIIKAVFVQRVFSQCFV